MANFTPICVQCAREMRCRKNDYLFLEYGGEAVWAGDMYGCESCGAEVVGGFGRRPVRVKGEDGWLTYRMKAQLELTHDPPKAVSSIKCPHCHWGIAPSAFRQHLAEKHGVG